ncbi:MAG: YbaK/EbsC family protein [Myxococcales bacterium]
MHPDVADRHSGYQVGGTSPFGLRRAMPIYMQSTILELPLIYINGGARGFLVNRRSEGGAAVAGGDAGRGGSLMPQHFSAAFKRRRSQQP